MSVELLVIIIKELKGYPSTYYKIQGSCCICSDIKFEHFTSKLESQPLS